MLIFLTNYMPMTSFRVHGPCICIGLHIPQPMPMPLPPVPVPWPVTQKDQNSSNPDTSHFGTVDSALLLLRFLILVVVWKLCHRSTLDHFRLDHVSLPT